jgi:hypothetical protein
VGKQSYCIKNYYPSQRILSPVSVYIVFIHGLVSRPGANAGPSSFPPKSMTSSLQPRPWPAYLFSFSGFIAQSHNVAQHRYVFVRHRRPQRRISHCSQRSLAIQVARTQRTSRPWSSENGNRPEITSRSKMPNLYTMLAC